MIHTSLKLEERDIGTWGHVSPLYALRMIDIANDAESEQ